MSSRLRRWAPTLLGVTLALQVFPAAASATPLVAPSPTASSSPALAPLAVALTQGALSYDAPTNSARIRVTATPAGAAAPWQYSLAVRGATVSSGSTSGSSVAVIVTNNCSITTQSVTVTITDAGGSTGTAAGTLDRSLCPPPPNVPHAADRIMHGPTLTETSFVDRLRAVGSPALAQGHQIYQALVAGGVNPAFALGTFQAESGSGTRGYAVTTKNWGNILYYSWEAAFGAVPYKPGNGYTYAKYPTWLASVKAFVQLLTWYNESGYLTVSSASAHWLGAVEGSSRHLTYLGNITAVMSILPTDAVPVMTSLAVPAASRAAVVVRWGAKDDRRVTGYQVRTRHGSGTWSSPVAVAGTSRNLTLTSGTWTIGVRASDADGNWSPWRTAAVRVDAVAPVMSALTAPSLVRSANGRFTVRWSAHDAVGVTRYQYHYRRTTSSSWSSTFATTATNRSLSLASGTWYVAVRAADAVGNWSAWRQVRVIVPVDDRSYRFSSGTVRGGGSLDYRGTITATSRTGARLTATFTGTTFYLLGRSGPGYGRLRVTIDGRSYLVDTGFYHGSRARITRTAVVLFSRTLASGRHVVTITNLGTAHRATIAIDGLGFGR